MKLNFRQEVLVLPGSVLSCCDNADAAQMRVLLWLASDLDLVKNPRQLAKLAGCSAEEAKRAVELWRSAGVLAEEDAAVDAMAAPVDPPKKEKGATLLRRADELPNYTTTELAEMIEHRHGFREMVDEAQQILGKMFNTFEINILVGMVDYLALDEECVLLLLAHCKRIGKTNLRTIEKYAYTLIEAGITDACALEERMHQIELFHSFEGEIRAMFGMKSRALSSKEKKMLQKWMDCGFEAEAVRRAYDITVNATNEPSVAYANAILERWNAEGAHTAAEVDALLARESEKKGEGTTLGNSFDTDDFFEAALKRSFDGIDAK